MSFQTSRCISTFVGAKKSFVPKGVGGKKRFNYPPLKIPSGEVEPIITLIRLSVMFFFLMYVIPCIDCTCIFYAFHNICVLTKIKKLVLKALCGRLPTYSHTLNCDLEEVERL